MTYNPAPAPFSLLRAGLSLAAMLLAAGLSRAADPTVAWDEGAARHLLSRACFGGTPEQAKALASLPLDKAVDKLLDDADKAEPLDRPEWVREVWVNTLRRYSDMPREEYLVTFRRTSTRNDEELLDLKARWVRHMARTPAPLRENLTLFWHGHFTSASRTMFGVSQAFYHQNATWRKHATGNFRTFLEAATLDPGMMIYLDMEESEKSNPNENYARELLELFALGVGNYTETDIREVARSLTGWTLDAPPGTVKPDRPTSPETAKSLRRDGLVPTFVPARHDAGEKTVFGKTGRYGVKEVLDLVVAHPACGPHLAGRLIDYFGAHDPNGALKARMAKAFADGKYELRPILKVLFTSPEFYAAEARGNRVKGPIRLLVGACRDFDLRGEITPSLAQAVVPLGQELFNPPTVKGWPGGNEWITATTLALRYRLGEVVLDGKPLTGTQPLGRERGTLIPRDPVEAEKTVARLLALDAEKADSTGKDGIKVRFESERIVPKGLEDGPEKLVDHLLARVLVVKPRAATRESIVAACKAVPAADRAKPAARLILASPEYQVE
ncbi:MAG: DUF1800 domain-containing protein [Gemmataceae bacterium]